MNRLQKNETNRRIGAGMGLGLGIAIMYAINQPGLVPAFILGAGGCLLGGVIGERIGVGPSASVGGPMTVKKRSGEEEQ